jgi:hypothetical protein
MEFIRVAILHDKTMKNNHLILVKISHPKEITLRTCESRALRVILGSRRKEIRER